MTLVGGVLTDDFNYGYPYNDQYVISPPGYLYSAQELTNQGELLSTEYRRSDFRLQYLSPMDDANNKDIAPHGGSSLEFPNYLLFPLLQWGEVQILTVTIENTADGVFEYDRAFDGYIADNFLLLINGKEYENITNTSGYSWTRSSVQLGKGINRISFVLKTTDYNTYLVRNGEGQDVRQGSVPDLPRYMRITRLRCTNVAAIPSPPSSYIIAIGGATMTATGRVNIVSPMRLTATSSMALTTDYSGPVYMSADTTMAATPKVTITSPTVFQSESSMTVTSGMLLRQESTDGGFTVTSGGGLTVSVPVNVPVGLVVNNLLTVKTTMATPTIIEGRPILPAYVSRSTATTTSAGTYTLQAAPLPAAGNNILPVPSTWRWMATDVPGQAGAPVPVWPNHGGGGPSWLSSGIYQPTVEPLEHFGTSQRNYVTYDRTINFYWRYAQHMWMTMDAANQMGATPTSYTMMFVGIMHPMTSKQFQRVLDAGIATPDTPDNEAKILNNQNFEITEGLGTNRAYFGLRPGIVERRGNGAGTPLLQAAANIQNRPLVYTVVANNGRGTVVRIRGYGVEYNLIGSSGESVVNNFVLGRINGRVGPTWGAHMSLFEINYWNRALSYDEIAKTSHYLGGVYEFGKFR